jgi:hypothetical protein
MKSHYGRNSTYVHTKHTYKTHTTYLQNIQNSHNLPTKHTKLTNIHTKHETKFHVRSLFTYHWTNSPPSLFLSLFPPQLPQIGRYMYQQQQVRASLARFRAQIRVARRFSFKPKIPIWVNFGRVLRWKLGILYGGVWYFTAIGYICWWFGMCIFPRFGMLYQ